MLEDTREIQFYAHDVSKNEVGVHFIFITVLSSQGSPTTRPVPSYGVEKVGGKWEEERNALVEEWGETLTQ